MKFYIATRLENHKQHNLIRDRLVNVYGHEITYDWTVHGPVWAHGDTPKQRMDRIQEVAILERQGVEQADIVIALLPGGRGTHAEIGMALALGKPTLIQSEDWRDFAAHPNTCAFYHDPLVYPNVGAFSGFRFDINDHLWGASSETGRRERWQRVLSGTYWPIAEEK